MMASDSDRFWPAAWRASPAPDRATAALLAQLAAWSAHQARTLDAATPEAARAMMRAMLRRFGLRATRRCRREDIAAPVPMRLYRPLQADLRPGCVVFLHGGGWALGDVASYDPLVSRLAVQAQTVFVSVDYRLAPEHPFPAALLDGLAAIRWLRDHATGLGIDPARILLMGDSAGGGLAAALARCITRESPQALAGQVLLYPLLDVASPHERYPSRLAFGDGAHFLTRADIDTAAAWYAPDPETRADPRVSPLREHDLAGLPPTCILTAGLDPLRDEGMLYAQKLKAAGVWVRLHQARTTIHGFLSFGALPVAVRWRRRITQWVRSMTDCSGTVTDHRSRSRQQTTNPDSG